ncbi:MAG: HAMP domain-containing histidine kinase [Oligoflexia bacterium]|nr:HAMP domain-containing histidine kinase [Oligoflexia bacterium]
MLHEFLAQERDGILALCARKLALLADARASSSEMEKGLPVFYDELIEVLRADEEGAHDPSASQSVSIHRPSAIRRGKESLRLGYTISQVVHGYGALCQAVTEYVGENGGEPVYIREFNRLNFCLDIAIAEAVTEFNRLERENVSIEEIKRLGFLVHELRNSLNVAVMAHRMIKSGRVGASGNTNQILEDALERMREIIDRSMSEVRLHSDPTVDLQRCRILHLISATEITAQYAAREKSIHLELEISPELEVLADPHLIISALSNIVQNAIKFTKPSGTVRIRSSAQGGRVLIEVMDQCGGLPQGQIEDLFKPYTQKGADKPGLGLGLTIASRAVELCGGSLSARDLPGEGCVFQISLPELSTGAIRA